MRKSWGSSVRRRGQRPPPKPWVEAERAAARARGVGGPWVWDRRNGDLDAVPQETPKPLTLVAGGDFPVRVAETVEPDYRWLYEAAAEKALANRALRAVPGPLSGMDRFRDDNSPK